MAFGSRFGFGGILGGGQVPDVQMPDGLPVAGGKGSPLVDAFIALQGQRIKDAVTAPRDAYTGDLQVMGPDGHPTAEAMDRAAGLAGLAMTGSMPFKAPKGALRMFGGGEAHEDPLAALSAALGDFQPTVPTSTVRRLDPSAPSWDLYHGSTPGPDFARFDPAAAKNPADRGGVFFAPSAETASGYAGSPVAGAEAGSRVYRATVEPGKTSVFDLAHLAETDPAFNARAREITAAHNPANAPLFDDYMNTFRASRAQDKDIAKQAAEMGYDVGPDAATPVSYGHGHIGAAIERAKAQGLDTAILRGLAEHGMDDQVVALTPGRVRSYYDPSQVLFNGGPSGALAGLPALASSSDPKGPPVSAGIPFSFGPLGRFMPGVPKADLPVPDAAQISFLTGQRDPNGGFFIPPGVRATAPAGDPSGLRPGDIAPGPGAPLGSPLGPTPDIAALLSRAPMGAPQSFAGASGAIVPNEAPEALQARMVPLPPSRPSDEALAAPLSFGHPPRTRQANAPTVAVPSAPTIAEASPIASAATSLPATTGSLAQPAAESSLLDRLGDGLRSLNANGGGDLLTSLGMGLLSKANFNEGISAGLQNDQAQQAKRAATGLATAEMDLKRQKLVREQQGQNQTRAWLVGKGLDPAAADAAIANPSVLSATVAQMNKDPSRVTIGGNIYELKPGDRPSDANKLGPAQPDDAGQTADQKNYEAAKQGGYTKSFLDYQLEKANASRAQTTVNATVNPILKGLADQFTSGSEAARASADVVRAVQNARSQVDAPGGIYSGAFADNRLALQKLGAAIGVADPSTIQNTEAFRTQIKPIVLETVKGLGAGSGVSNADRDFALQAVGGDIKLDEGTIRRVLDITERSARAKIDRHNALSDQMLETQPELKQIAPMLRIGVPEAMPQPQPQQGSQPTQGAKRLRFNPATGSFD